MTASNASTFGPFRLDAATESVWRGAEEIRLRPKTFALLRYLVERPARLVTKDELLEAIWPDVAIGEAALAVCIGEIRKALGDEARTPRFIETVHRRGYRLLGATPATNDVVPPTSRSDIVGRDDALGRLTGWLERAKRGERQIRFVTGPPGIGKTALVDTFAGTLPAGEFWWARGQCLDHYGAGEPYLPVLEAFGRLARGERGDRIVAVLARYAPTWLVQMPGLMSEEALARLQPRVLGATRERMLREMAEALEALAAEQPLILLLEDLHWSDPSTLDLIAAVARRREAARLLLIGTYRPVDVIARGHPLRAVTQDLALHGASDELSLEVLGQADVARYLTARFGSDVGAQLAPVIHRRTDGLPLFLVNVVDALVRQGLLAETAGRWAVNALESDVNNAVPDSLRKMIDQQLRALTSDEQRWLEAASVAGTTFSAAALAAAVDDTLESVEDHCEDLARREQFIRDAGVEEWPDGTTAARYRFLHVLYQQVLYERLTPARRASLHRRIGEREEAAYRGRPDERAAALAAHFDRGRDATRAVRYYHRAAAQALQRFAYAETVEHVSRGRSLLESVADETTRFALELALQLTLGPALIASLGPGAPELEDVYLRARDVAEHLDDPAGLYAALWGLWFANHSRGRYERAREMGERLLAVAERGHDGERLLQAHHALWACLMKMGELDAAMTHIERGQRLHDAGDRDSSALLYGGHDATTCGSSNLAWARWFRGYPDGARAAVEEARRFAAALDEPRTTIICLCYVMWVHHLRGDVEDARRAAHEAIEVATAHGIPSYVDDGAIVLACTGDGPPIADVFQRLRTRPGRAVWRNVVALSALAHVAIARGHTELGGEILDAMSEDHHGLFAPEIMRLRGEALLRRDDREEAEACFRAAIALAQRRGQRASELRVTTSLARLLAKTDRRDEARGALGEIYGWFTEGFDTADLREARSLLDELADPAPPSAKRRVKR